MSRVEELLRPEIRRMENYQVQPVSGEKLDANESPFSLPAGLKEKLIGWLMEEEDLRVYPDTDCIELREALAEKYGLRKENVLCAVGSDQLIDYLSRAFLSEGDRILVPEPSFSMYSLSAVINHGAAAAFPLGEDFAYPVETILEWCASVRPKILYLCTPNNPTGNGIPEADLRRLIREAGCIVALDEAYGEFCGENHTAWIREFPHLVILKTFSKAYGLAGIRTGYALGSEEIIRALDKVRAPYNLGTLSQKIALWALCQPEYEAEIHQVVNERDRMYAALQKYNGTHGFFIYPSSANFFLMRFGRENPGQALLDAGFLVRAYGGKMRRFVRVTVGRPDQNDRLLRQIMKIIEEDEA